MRLYTYEAFCQYLSTLRISLNIAYTGTEATTHDLPHCSPFDRISDREWRQVAAYILSLRSPL